MPTLTRSRILFGQAALDRFAVAHVLICGCGAVGTFAIETLVRNGVRHFTLIDSDYFEISNINRQLYATHDTLGQIKTEVAKDRILSIAPDAHVEIKTLRLTPDNCATLLDEIAPDILLDAIDDLPAKVALLAASVRVKIPTYSSMGAARKTDPLQIKVADIAKTTMCPLAKQVRSQLRIDGITRGITCAYSVEPATPQVPGQPLGSTLCVTGPMGIILATQIIRDLRALSDSAPRVSH